VQALPTPLSVSENNPIQRRSEMKNITVKMNRILNALNSKTGKMVIMVVVLALFVLSAGAPNATIGIGK